MKKNLLIICLFLLSSNLYSQQIIKNGSFETWNTFKSKLYPDNWYFDSIDVDKNILKRVAGGTQGSYAVHLGSSTFDGEVLGSRLSMIDTVLSTPGGILFEFKIFNNNDPILNGAWVEISFFDKNGDLIKKHEADFHTNTSNFQTGGINFNFFGIVPVKYLLTVEYFNFGGSTNEYAIFDNLRFVKPTGSVSEMQTPEVNIYPNPAKGFIHLDAPGKLGKVKMISIDGKITELLVENSGIDVSGFKNGFYMLELYNYNNSLIKREKISLLNN